MLNIILPAMLTILNDTVLIHITSDHDDMITHD